MDARKTKTIVNLQDLTVLEMTFCDIIVKRQPDCSQNFALQVYRTLRVFV